MAGRAQQQKREAPGGVAFGVRKQREQNGEMGYKPSKPNPGDWYFHESLLGGILPWDTFLVLVGWQLPH